MAWYDTIVVNLKTALEAKFVSKDDSRLTDARTPTSHTHTKSEISDFPSIPDVSGKIDTAGTGLSKSGTTLNHSNSITAQTTAAFKKIKYDAQGHVTGTADVAASDLPSHTHSQYLTSHQSLDSKTVTVTKQTTAESGYAATYIVKQNNTQVGEKINIPKDFLVKSASMKTCTTANSPLNGLAVNDPYLDFVVNTKENDDTDEHIYINVADLVDTYTAGTGLTLSNGAFSVNYGTSGTTACAGNDSRLSDARTPTSHTHGNLQNNGQVGSTAQANKNVVTDSNGKITTEDKPTIPTGSSTATDIKMNGTQSAGSSSNFAKADHIHPSDISRVAVAQGSGNSGKFLKVDSSGNVACESVTIPSAYTHPVTHPTSMIYENINDLYETEVLAQYAEGDTQHDINMAIDQAFIQVSSNIPTTSSSIPSADVSGGAIGSSSNYAKADHQHPLSSAYATASHNQNLSTINNVTTVAVVVTYTDNTSETLNLVKYTGS